ncbi:MAG: hypothetical protein GY749_02310 [Desulfobacteraceae bacterium]|nr:hypothetical protein [Desulfobacteraceae bacterium]
MKKVFPHENMKTGNRQPTASCCQTETGSFHKKGTGADLQEYFIILFLFMMLCFVFPFSASAQIEIASSPNPVGSGARALGMGGAFIGVADDATAASWNPGGLVQLPNPEISVVMSGFHRVEDNVFADNPEASGTQSVTEKDINYFSVVYPFNLFERNMVVSLNYQNLYDFTREWSFPLKYVDEFPFGTVITNQNSDYRQTGNLSALGIAYCIQIVPQFSFGVTLNFWDDLTDNEWESNSHIKGNMEASFPIPVGTFENTRRDLYQLSGFNFNIGMLWRTTSKLTTGFVFKSPFTADLKHERTMKIFENGIQTKSVKTVTDEKMDMPMSCGLGIAYRFSDRLTLSADIYRTEWDDLTVIDSENNESSLITGKSTDKSKVDPTYQVRAGMEYLIIDPELNYTVPLRAGIFYDAVPSEGSPDNYYGFSLGSGFAIGRYVFDIAYQYRVGSDVGDSLVLDNNFSQDVDEHMVYTSLIIHF